MFTLEILGITVSNFEEAYSKILDNVNAEKESDEMISVNELITLFGRYFGLDRISLNWEKGKHRDDTVLDDFAWRKHRLYDSYAVREILVGRIGYELPEPFYKESLPENHDIKTEDCCLVKASEKIVDGGKRMSFGEGLAEREPADGKGHYDLITPFGIRRLAIWYELGAKKYADRNWEKGMPFSRYIDAAKRHLDKYIMGMTDEDHLAAAAWNILSIMHHEELGQMEFDDMPHYMSDESQKERVKKQLNALYGMKKEEKDHE